MKFSLDLKTQLLRKSLFTCILHVYKESLPLAFNSNIPADIMLHFTAKSPIRRDPINRDESHHTGESEGRINRLRVYLAIVRD